MLLRYDVNSYCKAVVLYKKDFENAHCCSVNMLLWLY